MIVINLPRRGGKTHHIICELAKDQTSVVIVDNASMAEYYINKGVEPHRVILAHQAKEKLRGTYGKVYIDELDTVLMSLLGAKPELATMTGIAMTDCAFQNPYGKLEEYR